MLIDCLYFIAIHIAQTIGNFQFVSPLHAGYVEGSTAVFQCYASQLEWIHNSINLINTERVQIEGNILMIADVQKADQGIYVCLQNLDNKTKLASSAQLNVLRKLKYHNFDCFSSVKRDIVNTRPIPIALWMYSSYLLL